MKYLKAFLPFIVVIVLSYWAIKPLLIPGFFPIHDDTQVARVFEMTKSLNDGMFPVRWVSDLGYGYGYPIFNFYAPLAYYVGSAFMFLSFDALVATKIMMGFGIILSGIFMYLLGKEFWGKLGGIVSAVFYVYAPYHAVDIYVRGDVAEFWAYAFIPLAFLGIYKIFKTKGNLYWVAVGALGYAGIILSHNLTAMMVTPFILIVLLLYCYIAIKKKELYTIRYPLYAIILGLALSAFYFIPALVEQRYTNVLSQIGGGADYKDHFVCLFQLWQSDWGFGGSAPGCFDGVSFMIGKVTILGSLLILAISLLLLITKKISQKDVRMQIIFLCLLGFVVSMILMLPISAPVWNSIPLMAFFQYPWRFLILASFFSSLLIGVLIWQVKLFIKFEWVQYAIAVSLIVLAISLQVKFFIPQTILGKTTSDYTSAPALKWTMSKISDEYMPKDFPKPQTEKDVASDRVTIDNSIVIVESVIDKTQMIALNLNALKQTNIHFNVAYFPAWKLMLDGNFQGSIVKKGYDVNLPKGKHTVSIKFTQTTIEIISNLISVAGLAIIIIGIIRSKKRAIYG